MFGADSNSNFSAHNPVVTKFVKVKLKLATGSSWSVKIEFWNSKFSPLAPQVYVQKGYKKGYQPYAGSNAITETKKRNK